MGGQIAPVDDDVDGSLLRAATEEHVQSPRIHELVGSLPYRDSRLSGSDVDYHEERSLYGRLQGLEASGVAAYHIGGWYDGFPRETALWYANYPGPQKMMIGPWYHAGLDEVDAVEHVRWFDYWLKGIDNGVVDEDPIHYYTIGAPEETAWRSATTWPLPEEQRFQYYLHRGPTGSVESVNDGLLAVEGRYSDSGHGLDAYVVDYSTSVGLDNRWTLTAGGAAGGEPYANLLANDEKALTYTTEPLAEDLEVTGHPVIDLWVTSTSGDVDLFVYLEDVRPDGTSVMVTEGMLRASHRRQGQPPYDNLGLPWHTHRQGDVEPLPDAVPTQVSFDLMPTSVLFRRGHRIRLVITAADADTFKTPAVPDPPTVSIHRTRQHPSVITLPVIPG